MLRRCCDAAVALLAILVGSCSAPPPNIVEVKGVVLIDGEPLPKAKVRFFPQIDAASSFMAQGVTDDQGRFTLACNGQPGAATGENHVLVLEDDIPTQLTPEGARAELQVYLKALKNRPIPQHYGNAAQSPLKVTVTADQQEYKIELIH